MFVKAALIRRLPHSSDQAMSYLVEKILKFVLILLASWIMAKIEARTIADYGLPWRQMFGRQFWTGAAMAFLGLTAFLTLSHFIGFFRFGEIALRGNEIWKWGALYGFGFIVVALEEEFHYRGYQLSTLTKELDSGLLLLPCQQSLASAISVTPARIGWESSTLVREDCSSAFCYEGVAISGCQ